MASLRQSFLNGSLTRLLDPDKILRSKVVEFVSKGDFGLGSGQNPDGTYGRFWFEESVAPDEVTFEREVFLLLKTKAKVLKTTFETPDKPDVIIGPETPPEPPLGPTSGPEPGPGPEPESSTRTYTIAGSIPPEIWNRLGTKVIPKLRNGSDLTISVEFSVSVDNTLADTFQSDLKQILGDLGLSDSINIQ